MRRQTVLVASVLAGVLLGTVSYWLYDLLRDQGFFPTQPTWKAAIVVVISALPLILLVLRMPSLR